ncbi:MAG: bifunctional diaminohydroxyphosphoribosylaminopyrimidine deaminase/5-amino-6-(5-phosphoribosylamino)uracil reductase RibD [Candidatus Marinimicrobia bacterium]|nr:bifunctional diaminohydroxyphosphoribosylaminopyrimidine deaminase/5-amino-6-(5-phosphoribosylamino)uracil reductase RibD [Candidatus Neomarinimicrobiota bacterium]
MQDFDHHRDYMLQALTLSTQGIGRVSPNPIVGCLVVHRGKIIAQGYHHGVGGVHAEVDALAQIDKIPQDSILYVTVEPCSVHSKTPPCTARILKSGIKKVVVGMRDPNPAVNGNGISELEQKGVHVISGILEDEIQYHNRGFTKWIREGLPWVIVKLAQSSDGYMSVDSQKRTHLTGEEAQMFTHQLRSSCGGLLVGRKTALLDDPGLTVRVIDGRNPIRFIADTFDTLPKSLKIFRDQQAETIILSSDRYSEPHVTSYCRYLTVKEKNGRLSPTDMLKKIGKSGVTTLLIEGGAELISSFLSENLVDELYSITAPDKLIKNGLASPFRKNHKWEHIQKQKVGKDIINHYEKKV